MHVFSDFAQITIHIPILRVSKVSFQWILELIHVKQFPVVQLWNHLKQISLAPCKWVYARLISRFNVSQARVSHGSIHFYSRIKQGNNTVFTMKNRQLRNKWDLVLYAMRSSNLVFFLEYTTVLDLEIKLSLHKIRWKWKKIEEKVKFINNLNMSSNMRFLFEFLHKLCSISSKKPDCSIKTSIVWVSRQINKRFSLRL